MRGRQIRPGGSWLRAACAAATLALCTPAQALQCWTPEAIGAARLREMDIMFDGVTLRCRRVGLDIESDVERFRMVQSAIISASDEILKARYGAAQSREGLLAYDKYLIGLENYYGGGSTDQRTCRSFQAVARELGKPGADADTAAALAFDLVRDPQLDGPRCPTARAP